MKRFTVKNMVFTALCMALGLTLPMIFHSIPNAGSIFLPMHIPVLICGFLCGGYLGGLCGLNRTVFILYSYGNAAYIPHRSLYDA